MRLPVVSFTGSDKVGFEIQKAVPSKHITLELGGNAAAVVLEDWNSEKDMTWAASRIATFANYQAGQSCISVQRVLIHDSIFEEMTNRIVAAVAALPNGDPRDEKTVVGPMINEAAAIRVEEWVNEAIKQGGEILCGGKRISETCFEPTVVWNPSQEAKVSKEEIFGPVVCVYPYSDRDEAINLANSLPYHFQAAVFTKDLDIAFDTVQKLNATAVMVNDHTAFRVDWMPFGGRDASGEGLGGIPYTMREMTREKLMVVKSRYL